jgi:uncharacterized protein YjiK
MKALKIGILGVLLTGWLTAGAWSQTTLPKGLEGVIPHYPKAKVIFAKEQKRSSQAIMECEDDPYAVMVFYRKSMTYRGWSILTGMELKRGKTLIFSQEDKRLQITATASESKHTTILVTIDR